MGYSYTKLLEYSASRNECPVNPVLHPGDTSRNEQLGQARKDFMTWRLVK